MTFAHYSRTQSCLYAPNVREVVIRSTGVGTLTIAVCYLSPEGFVLGADSTSTYGSPAGLHFYNHAQKIFEVGENSPLAIATWGLGGVGLISYRMLVARLADDLHLRPAATVEEVAQRWIDLFWPIYRDGPLKADIDRAIFLASKSPLLEGNGALAGVRTEEDEKELSALDEGLTVGFCIGGYVTNDRLPAAYVASFSPGNSPPELDKLALHEQRAYGAPMMARRLIMGFDDRIREDLLQSGKWSGSTEDLNELLVRYVLSHPILPIRDAVDYVYTCVFSTIKAFKFSSMSQICGGPIEIAVVTADRKFRWVRHKPWDSAITDGEP